MQNTGNPEFYENLEVVNEKVLRAEEAKVIEEAEVIDQNSLYDDSEDDLISDSDVKIFQSNNLTEASYIMGLVEKQIMYVLLSKINKLERKSLETDFVIRISEIEEVLEKKITNYKILREATKKIIDRSFEFASINSKGKPSIIQGSLIAACEYSEGIISIEVAKKILPYLYDFSKGFTVYSLKNVLKLSSVYSQRIYEILSRYNDVNSKTFSIEYLRKIFKLENKYKQYFNFKARILVPAEKEINEYTNIKFSLKEIKRNNKVEAVKFVINQKNTTKQMQFDFDFDFQNNEKEKKYYEKLVSVYKLADWQRDRIMKYFDVSDIANITYERIEMNKSNISNMGAYVWTIFKKEAKARCIELE
jgi:plasmid replication initiation protein